MKKIAWILLLVVFTTSCSLYQVTSEDTSTEFYKPKDSIDDVVYLENVSRPFTVIGNVTVNIERVNSADHMDRIIQKLKREAAILGGDAITNIRTNGGKGKWAQVKPKIFENGNVRSNFVADVIVFK